MLFLELQANVIVPVSFSISSCALTLPEGAGTSHSCCPTLHCEGLEWSWRLLHRPGLLVSTANRAGREEGLQERRLRLGCLWKGHVAVRARAGSAQRCWHEGKCPQARSVGTCSAPGCPSPPPAFPTAALKPDFQRQHGDDAALPSSGSSQPEAKVLCALINE